MYRRYYQRYDNSGMQINPSVRNTDKYDNDNSDAEDNDIDEVNITSNPEIIIPEKPTSDPISETNEDVESSEEYIPLPANTISSNSQATIDKSKPLAFGKFRIDDLLILALILILLLEGAQDPLIIIMLVFLFFTGF